MGSDCISSKSLLIILLCTCMYIKTLYATSSYNLKGCVNGPLENFYKTICLSSDKIKDAQSDQDHFKIYSSILECHKYPVLQVQYSLVKLEEVTMCCIVFTFPRQLCVLITLNKSGS